MITYSLELKDNRIEFATDNRELLNTAYDFLKVIADAIAYRNSVIRISRRIQEGEDN